MWISHCADLEITAKIHLPTILGFPPPALPGQNRTVLPLLGHSDQ